MSGAGTRRILHLAGSAVDDFHADLSRLYAAGCVEAVADPDRYEMHLSYITPDGRWCFPDDYGSGALAAATTMSLPEALAHIETLGIDAVVPQMFCLPGMVAYRALFDVLQIPYVGNRPDLMAISADKSRTRAIVAAAGVAVPDGQVVRVGDHPDIALPVVVKPVDADNSVGVTLVRSSDGLDAAIADAMSHSEAALVERYIELGREVRCGVIVRDGELVCLPLEEYAVDSDTKPIRGVDDKLGRSGDGELFLVAKDSSHAWIVADDDPIVARVWQAAQRCHVALGARHYSLFDFRIDPDGTPWFLEAGLYCSYSRSSVIATMAAAAGIDVRELFAASLRELDHDAVPVDPGPSAAHEGARPSTTQH